MMTYYNGKKVADMTWAEYYQAVDDELWMANAARPTLRDVREMEGYHGRKVSPRKCAEDIAVDPLPEHLLAEL